MSPNQPDLLKNKIVVCIPIALESREAIALSLLKRHGMNYVFAGGIFQDRTTDEYCLIDICDRECASEAVRAVLPLADRQQWTKDRQDSDLASLFRLLGQDRISNTTLEQIDNYQQIVYLISNDVGYGSCLKIAKFTQVFLSIGGIAVKVDSAGIVHERDKWLANYNSEDVFDIYSLFVTLVEGDDCYYSCGMSNFAKADVSIDITEDMGLAIYVVNVFNYHRLTEPVILKDGQTFQPDIECPIYQMQWSECNQYEINDPRSNPYGKWHLSRVTNDLDITYRIN
ncbi:conserved hypothetical protein [Hyella patelloides LEGE 07179]|uniref:DUF4261 domain-containing protein n=1 Tax=Hyella patelloides LEGE 07179 TaxID=945734 RepID=A0A563VSY1_9CYAN|nr:hypothetical protein [Hyella patelloides]VEP14497.1 conserved hypothetical protein [Hyella patelloides LEGE 07179]